MEKEKRIEEMAQIMLKKGFENYQTTGSVDIDMHIKRNCYFVFLMYAEALYNADYRKQEDILHEWVERETAYLNEISELKKELKKELAEHEEFTKKAKAEIERLASVNMQTIGKNADLQMKVDEYYQKAFVYYKKCKAYGMDFKDEEFEIQAKDGKVFKMPKFTTNEEEVE